jgi:hypothetical protein
MLPKPQIEYQLAHCYGGESYYKTMLPNLYFTEGVKTLRDLCECQWLIDAILSYQPRCHKDSALKECQFWDLKKEKNSWMLTCRRDKNDVAFSQRIGYSDFPLDEITIWVINKIVMLPSEY